MELLILHLLPVLFLHNMLLSIEQHRSKYPFLMPMQVMTYDVDGQNTRPDIEDDDDIQMKTCTFIVNTKQYNAEIQTMIVVPLPVTHGTYMGWL